MGATPDHAVQLGFWIVLASLGLLGGGIVLVLKAKSWLEEQIKAVSASTGPTAEEIAAEVTKAVAEAMRLHEDREQRWREDDRKDTRERLKELQARLDDDLREIRRRIERLEDAVQALANRPRADRSSDVAALLMRLESIEAALAHARASGTHHQTGA